MATLLEDITSFLVSHNVSQGDGIDTFRDFTPDSPDSIVTLNEYPGDPIAPEDDLVNRSVQIAVRDIAAEVAQAKSLEIFKLFKSEDLVVHFTNDRWGQVHLRQPPFRIRTDASNRVFYGFNIGITTTID